MISSHHMPVVVYRKALLVLFLKYAIVSGLCGGILENMGVVEIIAILENLQLKSEPPMTTFKLSYASLSFYLNLVLMKCSLYK